MTNDEKIQKMQKSVNWFIGIALTIITLLFAGAIRSEIISSETKEKVEKINRDYTPLFVMEGIVGSNDKLINILNTLPSTTKDDPRYLDAIKERSDFQREMLNRASVSKRGGGSSPYNIVR